MKMFTRIRPFLKAYLILIAAYLAFACLSCLLPNKPIHKHIADSLYYGDLQCDYPRAVLPKEQCRMDNFTDALILNQAYRCSSDSLMKSMLEVWRATGPQESVQVLKAEVEGLPTDAYPYSRYWHGSTFLTRFLLLASSYTGIRMILFLVSMLLMTWMAAALYRRLGTWPTVSVLMGMGLMYVFVMQFSMQFFPVLAITIIAAILAGRMGTDRSRMVMVMFVVGSLTAYFDLLTVPLITLGVPVCVMLAACRRGGLSVRDGLHATISVSLLWSLGYGITWVTKWLLASMLTSQDAIADGIGQVSYRAGLEDFSRLDAIVANTDLVPWNLFLPVLVVLAVLAFVRHRKGSWMWFALFLLVALMPYAWYLVVANHSFYHCWFTYREQMISLVALFMAFGSLVDWSRLRNDVARLPLFR